MQALFGAQNQQLNNIMQTMGIADIAFQGYQAYQSGKMPEFFQDLYDKNFVFRLFYDGSKDKTLREIMSGFGINLDGSANSVVK